MTGKINFTSNVYRPRMLEILGPQDKEYVMEPYLLRALGLIGATHVDQELVLNAVVEEILGLFVAFFAVRKRPSHSFMRTAVYLALREVERRLEFAFISHRGSPRAKDAGHIVKRLFEWKSRVFNDLFQNCAAPYPGWGSRHFNRSVETGYRILKGEE